MSDSNWLEESILKTMRGGGNGVDLRAPANMYVQLHVGDPGEDGTANVARNTTRQRYTAAAPSNPAGTMATNADVTWTNVAATERYTHFSTWDDPTAGNPWKIGQLTAARDVTAGDTFVLTSGQIVLSHD